MNHKYDLLISCTALAGAIALASSAGFAQTPNSAKPGAAHAQPQPGAAAKPAPSAAKIQLIVEVAAGESDDAVKQALDEAHGQIVKVIDNDISKFYVIEVDKTNYAESYKKLTADKKFKTVQLNRGYKLR
ncbi:MAG TPA: hypothetical protein V6C81_09395 [Planktothrix sp.]|jgi:predicted nucleic-acid-binding Zn-ribbon protein